MLINPGAEEYTNGWTQGNKLDVIVDSHGTFHNNYHCHSGTHCFAGGYGPHGEHKKIIQRINLLNGIQNFTEEQIDSGKLTVYITFYYQTFIKLAENGDIVKVDVSFHNNVNQLSGGIHTGELRCKRSNPGWCDYQTSTSLTAGTRFINYAVLFYRDSVINLFDKNIDSYNDDNSLIIK